MDWKQQLSEWVDEYPRVENDLVQVGLERAGLSIFTATNEYKISATATYLGCIATARTPRPGEDWTRGNDLPDGPFSLATWTRILDGIVRYELLDIAPKTEGKELIPLAACQCRAGACGKCGGQFDTTEVRVV